MLYALGGNPPVPAVSYLVPLNGSKVAIGAVTGIGSTRRILAFFPEYGAAHDNSGTATLHFNW